MTGGTIAERKRAERTLVELLRPGGPRELDGGADDLLRAAHLAAGHGFFLLADRGVREQIGSGVAVSVGGAYAREARPLRLKHVAAAVAYERAQESAVRVLAERGIVPVVLKGPGLNREIYGEAPAKTSADIDLLVRARDVAGADAALAAAGFVREDDLPLAFRRRRSHHALYARPGGGVPVELHWGISVPGFFELDEGALWEATVVDGPRAGLSAAMTLVQLLMHHHLHACGDLRTLVDLAWAVNRWGGAAEAGGLQRRLQAIGLSVVAAVARVQAERLWGPLRWPPGWGETSSRLRARFLARVAAPRLRRDPDRDPAGGVAGPLVVRLSLDSPRRVLWSFAKTVLPSAGDLEAFSPAGGGPQAGYVQYWRWRLGGRSSVRAEREARRR